MHQTIAGAIAPLPGTPNRSTHRQAMSAFDACEDPGWNERPGNRRRVRRNLDRSSEPSVQADEWAELVHFQRHVFELLFERQVSVAELHRPRLVYDITPARVDLPAQLRRIPDRRGSSGDIHLRFGLDSGKVRYLDRVVSCFDGAGRDQA